MLRKCFPLAANSKFPAMTRTAWLALAFLAVGRGAALAQRPLGIDVSHYDGQVYWPNVKNNSGIAFAWSKATEGTTFQDAVFTYNQTNGKAAGVYMGAYHFARYD